METTTRETESIQPTPAPRKPRRRRGNGEGSIYQRKDGRWCATINAGYAPTGKRLRRTVYGATKREVQEKLTRLQTQKLDGMLNEPTKLTVSGFLARWLEDSARPSIRRGTYVNYKGVVENHVSPRLGGIALTKLTAAHVQGLYADMERGGASGYTRKLAHAVLHRSLKQAVKWGMIQRNVCDAVDPPRLPKTDIHPLNAAQASLLLKAAEDQRLSAVYVLAIATGLRLGELFGLHWEDVDLEGKTLAVRHTLSEVCGKLVLAEPKSAKGRRRVNLPTVAVQALWGHKAKMLAEGNAAVAWVFCNKAGGPLRRHFCQQYFKPLLKRLGLPDIRFHDLRHTSATLLLSQGVHPKVVQEQLGHSQISITMDTYSHVLPSMQLEAADKMNRLLSGAAG